MLLNVQKNMKILKERTNKHYSYNLQQVGYTIVKRLESRLEQEEQKAKIERET
jgi:hypothetical protein